MKPTRKVSGVVTHDERGQAATEYVLILGLISIPIYIAFTTVFKVFLNEFIAHIITSFTSG